jgi:hypothetical protein
MQGSKYRICDFDVFNKNVFQLIVNVSWKTSEINEILKLLASFTR